MVGNDADYTVIEEGKEYALAAAKCGDGFRLRCKSEGLCADLRDDDARRFNADYQEIKERSPDWQPDQVLAQLWDHGGYSWLAKEEG